MGIRESREQVKDALVSFVQAVEVADNERDAAEADAEKLLEARQSYLSAFQDVSFPGDTRNMLGSIFAEDELAQREVARKRRQTAIDEAKQRFLEEWKALEAS